MRSRSTLGPLAAAVALLVVATAEAELYMSDTQSDTLFAVDPGTGAGSAIGSGFGEDFTSMHGLAFDPGTNTLYGVDTGDGVLVTISTVTGDAFLVGSIGSTAVGLAFDPATDTLYAVDTANNLIGVDTSTGGGSAIGPLGSILARGLAIETVPEPSGGAAGALAFLLALRRRARPGR